MNAMDTVSSQIQSLREQVLYADSAIPAKTKVLAAALWSVAARCEPCIAFYIDKARELGASDAEIADTMAVAGVMGGCVGEMWARKGLPATGGDCGCG